MDKKKMITYAVIAVIGLLILWQGMSIFGGDEAATQPLTKPNPETPKPASLMPDQSSQKQAPMTEREMQLMKLQQETQAKYLAALSELQMLRVNKDIAEVKRDVSKATLETITAQKGVIDLLAPSKPPVATADAYAQGLESNSAAATTAVSGASSTSSAASAPVSSSGDYKVVSVSKLRGEWVAVLGAAGALYSAKIGDVLPVDGSTVTSINKNGIELEKDGKTRKLSMVPII